MDSGAGEAWLDNKTFWQTKQKAPPYYYTDAWVWNGAWKKWDCSANYSLPGCDVGRANLGHPISMFIPGAV